MGSKGAVKSGCTFQWRIENFSNCWQKKGENFYSPLFTVDIKEETTKWRLVLCPKGYTNARFVSLYLHRAQDDSSEHNIEIVYKFSFVPADSTSSPLYSQSVRGMFHKGRIAGCPEFIKREDLFTLERAKLIPQDTLTIRCNLSRLDGENIEVAQIFARTVIQIEQVNFTWTIKEFSNLEPNQEVPFILKSFSKEALATFNLFLTDDCGNESICIEIIYSDKSMKLFKIKYYILDETGGRIDNTRQEFCFDKFSNSEKCTLLQKRKLLENESLYLPKDILSLEFECKASIGIAFEGIERIDLGCNSFGENPSAEQEMLKSSLTLKDDLKSIYCDGFLSDMTLRTTTEAFPVHKIILSARSPIFKTMFSTDMKETNDKCVDITDVDSDILHQLLMYIYTDTVEDLKMETASQLYEAADKYSILNLKDKCSSFMKNNLDPSNASHILAVADLHHDASLKLFVQDYILEHDLSVFNSEEWKQLMGSNPKLTSETMFRKFMQK